MGQILLVIIGFVVFIAHPWIVITIGIGYLLLSKLPNSFGAPRRGSDRSLGTDAPETRLVKEVKLKKAPSWLWGPEKEAFELGKKYKPEYSDDPVIRELQEQMDRNRQLAQEEMRRDIEREEAARAREECRGQKLGGA